MELALERLELRAHLREERNRDSEERRRPLAVSRDSCHRCEPLEAPGEILLVTRLAGKHDRLAEPPVRRVVVVEHQVDGATVEERPGDVRRVAARDEQGVALLEERPRSRVVARRQSQVAEVVDRKSRDPRVTDLAGKLDRLLEHAGGAVVVARGENDRTEVAQRIGDEPRLVVQPCGGEGLLGGGGGR